MKSTEGAYDFADDDLIGCIEISWDNWLVLSGIPFPDFNLIPSWLSNYINFKIWDEITHPFPDLNIAAVEVWELISDFISHFIMDVIIHPFWD